MVGDEYYYLALDVMDRIRNYAIEKGLKGTDISRALGVNISYWGVKSSESSVFRIDHLFKCAEVIDVSMEYLLTGKNKGKFEGKKFDLQKIYRVYKDKKLSVTDRERVFLSNIKRKKRETYSISVLLRFAHTYKQNPYFLTVE